MNFILNFLLFYIISCNLLAAEKLVIIQAVSTTKKTFIIHLGKKDGIFKGQESLFSTPDISAVARVIEVGRNNSLWVLADHDAVVPFHRKEVISFGHNVISVFTEISQLRKDDNNFNQFSKRPNLTFRGGFSYGIYQSITETDAERSTFRSGGQLEVTFGYFPYNTFEVGIGLRADYEVETQKNPTLDIPSSRYFMTLEIGHHFNRIKRTQSHYYVFIGAGFGQSNTNVNGAESSGPAKLLPYVRFGKHQRMSHLYGFVYELTAESVSMSENFSDKDNQTTNIINLKAVIGVKF